MALRLLELKMSLDGKGKSCVSQYHTARQHLELYKSILIEIPFAKEK
jgi:hypothetical protein